MESFYREAVRLWRVVALVSGDEVIGALFHREGVIHIGIVPEWRKRWATRGLLKACFRYGTKTTLLPGEVEQREFVRRAFRIEGLPCHS